MDAVARLLASLSLLGLLACGGAPPTVLPSPSAPPQTKPASPSSRPTPPAEVSPIDAATRERMRSSWRPGCPVPIDDLRLLTLNHWGFDGRAHRGEMVVHRDVAGAVVGVFEKLFVARFPINRMRLVDEYGADDNRSMEANNTSGFNCRRSTASNEWSSHAYGAAVDINPVQNPYVSSNGRVLPPAGKAHIDRSKPAPGKILAGDVVVKLFASIGWTWGGTYMRVKDYQHFSSSGR